MTDLNVTNTNNTNFNYRAETNSHDANSLTKTFKCIIDFLKRNFSNALTFMSENIPRPNFISSISNNLAINNNNLNEEINNNDGAGIYADFTGGEEVEITPEVRRLLDMGDSQRPRSNTLPSNEDSIDSNKTEFYNMV